MEYATLGNTGLLVSKLCFGTMTFGDGRGLFKAISSVGQVGADELVKTSIDGGINFFDTADNYTEGESEKILGQSLKNLNIARKDVVIATKVYSRVGPGRNDIGASRGHIMDGVEASLRRLQTDHIDLYQIHGNDSVTPVEETLRALDTLVQQGKVRYIGCSNWQAWKIAKALGISEFRNLARFDTLQAYYSIAGRDLEREIVPLLQSEKVGLLVWSPLAGGLLSGKYSRMNQKPADSRRTNYDFPIVDKERAWKILDVMAPTPSLSFWLPLSSPASSDDLSRMVAITVFQMTRTLCALPPRGTRERLRTASSIRARSWTRGCPAYGPARRSKPVRQTFRSVRSTARVAPGRPLIGVMSSSKARWLSAEGMPISMLSRDAGRSSPPARRAASSEGVMI